MADVFGFHALQLGLGELDALQANRMPHRWLALPALPAVPGDPPPGGAAAGPEDGPAPRAAPRRAAVPGQAIPWQSGEKGRVRLLIESLAELRPFDLVLEFVEVHEIQRVA